MPFERLAAYNLTIPRIDYNPQPIRGNPILAATLASIGPQIASIVEAASPEARQKRELANLELNLGKQKLAYFQQHPDVAFGGKTYDPLLNERRGLLVAQTGAANALATQRANTPPKANPNATFIDDPNWSHLVPQGGKPVTTNTTSGVTGIPEVFLPPS